ncbi:MFS transporter [Legionella qingyii]|uniref:MFS transporter n=1 Tax=Legionella qingyii TaxID=2184757 RepID=A0A317U2R9_9GAMM|nr:MFS transporter [Legionella qingyii]PWY55639.1 MFS transporter [Legionella qingyii]RUR21766.1 MFS transporter [Legionella qingyii]RUR25306.1 MFS transporter [Legionella qingyii]
MSKSIQSLLLISQFFMILALEMTNPFLSLLIASQNEIPLQSAAFYSMLSFVFPMLANIIMTPIWGLAADRFGYKSMLMRAAWALVFTQLAMIFVNALNWILIIRIVQGAFAGFIVSMQTYSLSLCEWQYKSRQLSRLQSAKAVATSLAGFAGGIILTATNYQGLYGIATVICLSITLVMHYYLPATPKNSGKTLDQKSEKMIFDSKPVYALCFLITLTQIIKFLPDPGLSLYINDSFSQNLILIGLLYSFPAVGMLLSSEWCGCQFDRCRTDPLLVRRYLIRYSVLGFILMLCQASINNLILFACIRILWGVVLAALLPALFALLSDRYPLPGYALGLANSFAKLGNLIGLLLGGLLINWLPYSTLFVIIAGLYCLFALFVPWLPGFFINPLPRFSNTYSDKT